MTFLLDDYQLMSLQRISEISSSKMLMQGSDDSLFSKMNLELDVNSACSSRCMHLMLLSSDDSCLLPTMLLTRCSTTDGHCMRHWLLLDVSSACRWVCDETMPWNFNSEGGVVVIKSL